MANVNLSLPDQIKDWSAEKGKSEHYKDASDYVCDLIRKDQEKEQKINNISIAVQEAMESGISSHTIEDLFDLALTHHHAKTHDGL